MRSIRRNIIALRSALVKRAGLLRVLALLGSALLVTVATPNAAEACGITDPASCVAMIFVKIFQLLTALMGWIVLLEVEALIRVAQYHNFVAPGPQAVQLGWVATRDLANMFFIVILLIIAFGTILGSSTYHYEKNLPRLLIMAVVINFSKTICGIFIDMGQVIMLTFVNGFKEAAGGNFINALQIGKLLQLADGQSDYTFGLVIAMMFAFVLAAIAACIVLVILVIMIFRIVMLWVLIILSPIAFLSSAIPKGGDYYAQWWKEFKKNIITGPIIAFFLWLALASVQQVGPGGFAGEGGFPPTYAGQGESAAAVSKNKIPTEAGTADVIMNMVIAISIMFAGLKFASDSGAVGAGFAKTMRSGIEKTGRSIATYGTKRAAQPFMTSGGKALAKIPLVGGLGRAMTLKGEQWKKERQGAAEKFAGTPEDMARLSPDAFNRNLKSLSSKGNPDAIDKKRLDGMLRAGLADPAMAASMGKSGSGKSAVDQLILNSKGKGLQDAVGLMMTDKNVSQWAKTDPSFLASAYDKVQREAFEHDKDGNMVKRDAAGNIDNINGKPVVKDPNMLKTLGELEQKFAPQLVKPDENGVTMMDPVKLKNLVPKMSTDDVGGLLAGDMSTFMPHMTNGQLRKLAQDGTPDQQEGMLKALVGMGATERKDVLGKLGVGEIPSSWYGNADVVDNVLERTKGDPKTRAEAIAKDKDGQLKTRADKRLEDALTLGDSAKVAAALPDAISVGSLNASRINSDSGLQTAIKNNASQIDLASIGRNVAVSDKGRSDAGKALATLIGDVNPEKIRNARRGGMSEHIIPTAAESDARAAQTRNDARDVYVAQAVTGALAAAIAGQVSQLRSVGADDQANVLNKKFEEVKTSTEKLKQTQDQLADAEKRLANTTGMTVDQMGALKNAADSLKKQVDDLKTSVAKAAADVKGEKFDTGGGGRNRRT